MRKNQLSVPVPAYLALRYLSGRIPASALQALSRVERLELQYQVLVLVLFGICTILTLIVAHFSGSGDAAFAAGQWVWTSVLGW